jgi:hypothetical protein
MYIPQEIIPGGKLRLASTLLQPQHLTTEHPGINGTIPTMMFFTNSLMMAPANTGLIYNHRPLVPLGQLMFKRRPGECQQYSEDNKWQHQI